MLLSTTFSDFNRLLSLNMFQIILKISFVETRRKKIITGGEEKNQDLPPDIKRSTPKQNFNSACNIILL